MRRFIASLSVSLAFGIAACGSDSDDGKKQVEDACLWQCDVGASGYSRTCVSQPNVSAAACQKMAEDSCGSVSQPVVHVQQIAGCSCPGSFGDTDECKSPPSWYWGNACFYLCPGEQPECDEFATGVGLVETEADCQQLAQKACAGSADAGAAPEQVELQTGCSCPTFGSNGECTAPPAWFQ